MDASSSSLWQSRAFLHRLLELFYKKYNPDRLGSIETILDSYTGQETQMFQQLCEKYEIDNEEFSSFVDAVKSSARNSLKTPANVSNLTSNLQAQEEVLLLLSFLY